MLVSDFSICLWFTGKYKQWKNDITTNVKADISRTAGHLDANARD
jgi:hypothetical protein